MDWVNAWRFSACSAQLVQGWKQGHLRPALALSLVAISVTMWGKPSREWSQQAETMWKWGVRDLETERDTEGEREWPCWAPSILCLMYIPGFPSSESQGEINSPLVDTWGPGLTGMKSRTDPHINKDIHQRSITLYIPSIPTMLHYKGTTPSTDPLPFWNWQAKLTTYDL